MQKLIFSSITPLELFLRSYQYYSVLNSAQNLLLEIFRTTNSFRDITVNILVSLWREAGYSLATTR